ncbi:mitochondrial escape protein 2 [Pseudohyphozyma bogoriensis]|nr:mitochondrial escape protein 2 [Pseudohyphozyma bogoriensis]
MLRPSRQLLRPLPLRTAVLRQSRAAFSDVTLDPAGQPTFVPPSDPTPLPLQHGEDGQRKIGYLFFNSIFPLKMGVWDLRYLAAKVEKDSLMEKLQSLVPENSTLACKVIDVYPREKDGGAFLKFSYIPPHPNLEQVQDPLELRKLEEETIAILEKEARDAIAAKGFKPWFAFANSKAFFVRGKPWMEDMNRFPNSRIRVEFEGPVIPQEELYDVFRPYGKIHDIVPQPPGGKEPPYADIIYTSMRSSSAARNCLHGALIPSTLPIPNPPPPTVVRILFADRVRSHQIREWATSHPRIMIPLIVALLGGLSWAVFDPVREFFVKTKIERTWDSDRWALLKWLKKETLGRLGLTSTTVKASTGIEKEREEAKELLITWLRDIPDTFNVVTGPVGSGKTSLVDQVTSNAENVLVIDCAQLGKSRSDTALASDLASAVGYWPRFALASSLNNMIDLASVGLIGQKAGFSASLDQELKQILEVTSSALKKLANERNARSLKAAKKAETLRKNSDAKDKVVEQLNDEGIKDGRLDTVSGTGAMAELGGGIERPDKDSIVIVGPKSAAAVKAYVSPEVPTTEPQPDDVGGLPIVVIKSFAAKGLAKQEVLTDVLAEWAAVLVENKVAHVVFTSDSIQVNKPLAKALPSKPFNVISLNDASPEAAIQYIESKLAEADPNNVLPAESHVDVAKVGGRQTDLELLVQKIKSGLTPEEAVQDLVSRSATELRKNFFGDDIMEGKSLPWTREQAYTIAKGLAANGELKYADVLVNSPFKSDEAALRALENAELVSVHHAHGRPSLLRPGKPIYRSAFQELLSDTVFSATIQYQINAAATKSASADLEAASKALLELSNLFEGGKWAFGGGSTVPKEVDTRVGALLGAMRTAEEKLAKLDQEKTELLKILATSA